MGTIPTGGASTAGGLSTGAQLGGAFISAGIQAIVGGAFAKADAKKQRAMEAELGRLSLAQQKDLEERLQNIKEIIESEKIHSEKQK